MTFKIPRGTGRKNSPTGLPDQRFYDEVWICSKCNTPVPVDRCPKCGRKATSEPVNPRNQPDLVSKMAKTRYEFRGLTPTQAIEILTNGDCSN